MSFIFCLSWLHRLRISNSSLLSICYIPSFFSMNISLLTTPSFRSPHVVVVWECKNSFFCIQHNTLAHFFLIFLHFFVILLCINKIKMHFFCFTPLFDPLFCPFLALSGHSGLENFADFREISAKIELSARTIRPNFCVILCNSLIICILHILQDCILLCINRLSCFSWQVSSFHAYNINTIYTNKYFVLIMANHTLKPAENDVFCIFAANLYSPTNPNRWKRSLSACSWCWQVSFASWLLALPNGKLR